MKNRLKGHRQMKGMFGFTLVELLVVVLIIGVLAAIGIPQYYRTVERSRAGEIVNLMGTIQSAEERNSARTNTYTDNFTALDVVIPGLSGNAFGTLSQNSGTTPQGNYDVVIKSASASTYAVEFTRANGLTNGAPAYYGNYVLLYNSCGGATGACIPTETSCPGTGGAGVCVSLVQ